MVKRKDIIFEKVKEISWQALKVGREPGVTAQELAELLKMDRGNVSKELNQLAAEGKLEKYEGRPVRFGEKKACEEHCLTKISKEDVREHKTDGSFSFQNIIGREGSLKKQIKQVKAAMLYPPHGLHTLLNGPTGTGKTLFAQQMYEYAKHMGMLKPESEFVIFNCAEYAENPQLIVSQIFGHKKGAFTGADKDKPGLIEQANGGILFLDEIHRLPPEGQEMLFSLMDYGKYRRLGETERNRTADVLIIGATTEDLGVVLLKTFLRRMPVVVQIPPLEQRSLLERLELIELFLSQEKEKIAVSVKISREAILSLLLYNCVGNVGQLKADIQLLCARAFWEYKVGKTQVVELDRQMLPFYIEQGFYQASGSRDNLIKFLIHGEDYYVFPANGETGESKWNTISKKYMIFHKFYAGKKETAEDQGIEEYISSMIGKENDERRIFSKDALNKVITGKVYYAVEEAVEFAEMRLKRTLSDNTKIGFALHINALVEGMDKKQDICKEKLQEIIDEHPQEAKVAKMILRILEDELNISIQKGEVGYITMFLSADTANSLLNTSHCKAINMPLNEDVEEVYKRTLKMSVHTDEGRGVLLLVDMGSLNMFAERIEKESGIAVRSVGMVSTLTVLEAVRKCTAGNTTLTEITDYLEQMIIHMLEERKHQKRENERDSKTTILVSCLSGMGAAKKIAEMVRAITGIDEEDTVQICCVGMDGMDESGRYLGDYKEKEILAVVGTADLQLDSVPYIPLDEIVAGTGIEKLEKILNGKKNKKTGSEKTDKVIDERVFVTALRELLEFLDAEKIVSVVLDGFYECEKKLEIPNLREKIVRYTIHIACMAERLVRKEILPYHNINELKERHQIVFEVVGEVLKPIEEMFQIEIPVTEKAYIVELLCEENEE